MAVDAPVRCIDNVGQIDTEGSCHAEHGVERRIPHLTLDVAHHLLRQARPRRERVHRQALAFTLGS